MKLQFPYKKIWINTKETTENGTRLKNIQDHPNTSTTKPPAIGPKILATP